MLALDEDAFICDMAQTYHVYDIRSLPLPYLATLASGLGMIDGWSKDGAKPLMSEFLEKRNKSIKSDSQVFASAEDFEAAKAAILGGNTDG